MCLAVRKRGGKVPQLARTESGKRDSNGQMDQLFEDIPPEGPSVKTELVRVSLPERGMPENEKGQISPIPIHYNRFNRDRQGDFDFDTMNHLFLISGGGIVAGSTHWNLGFGREKGEVAKDDEAAGSIKEVGQTIAG
jgi:hypothetical protein